ncbi:MFS transporter, partial [Vibrio breoganii]
AFSFVFYKNVTDTPKGSTYFKPAQVTAMEVTSKGDFFFLLIMKIPMYAALALLTWKLSPTNINMLSDMAVYSVYAGLAALYVYEVSQVWKVNKNVFKEEVPEIHRYKFKQVAVLNVLYFATF